jgi:hypothetical protein
MRSGPRSRAGFARKNGPRMKLSSRPGNDLTNRLASRYIRGTRKPKKTAAKLRAWRVSILRQRAEYLGMSARPMSVPRKPPPSRRLSWTSTAAGGLGQLRTRYRILALLGLCGPLAVGLSNLSKLRAADKRPMNIRLGARNDAKCQ